MASPQAKKAPGSHYSGANPIPNIQKFVQSLDRDKKERDAKIEADMKQSKASGQPIGGSEAIDHIQDSKAGASGTKKNVTDPVTGREVEIEDVNEHFMKAINNPMVRYVHSTLSSPY